MAALPLRNVDRRDAGPTLCCPTMVNYFPALWSRTGLKTQPLLKPHLYRAVQGDGFNVDPGVAPHVSRPPSLSQTINAYDKLSYSYDPGSKLPYADEHAPGKLSQGCQTDHKLPQAEYDADSELRHRDRAHGKLPDCYDPLCHAALATTVRPESDVNERDA